MWSPTSTSWSTSDRAGPTLPTAGAARLAARLRVVHPFPSLLNGAATTAIAVVAGGAPVTALRLGLAMTALQFSIGALNDLVDAPRDRGRRPVKAVAEGLLAPRTAMIIAAAASVAGLALAAPSGLLTLAVAAAGAACGYAYDLRLSRTAWAWLPLAVALPLVPVFAWTGATGGLPREFGVLVPIAMLAGAGLAIGNALADLDADAAAGAPSVVLRLGRRRAGGLHAAALGAAVALAVAGLPPGGPPTATWLALAGAIVLGLGMAALLSAGSGAGEARARLGWQVEAVGTALLGAAWAMAIAGAGAG